MMRAVLDEPGEPGGPGEPGEPGEPCGEEEDDEDREAREARLLEVLVQRVSQGDLVLEAGCGAGHWANLVARAVKCRILAVDIDGSGFGDGRDEAGRFGVSRLVEFLERDVADLPGELESRFDLALSLHSMHEFERPRQVLAAIREVLRPGGRLVVVDFIKGSEAERIWSERYYTPGELQALLEEMAFQPREPLFPWRRELVLIEATRC
jgi:ubiquinone/menaquinone biosynthesis C-methylase UbiE